jgi:hypothetical protein
MHRHVLWLAVVVVTLCGGTVSAQNADTVDGFHAYGTPHANALLALDGASHFPISVIPDNSIPGSKLAYGAVTNGRLRDGAVTTSKLGIGAVTAGRLGNNSVTTEKITDGQVMQADLAAGAVTSSKIANNSVTNTKIKNGTILGEDVSVPLTMTGNRVGAIVEITNSASPAVPYSSFAVHGRATGTAGYAYGVYGTTSSESGRGVFGWASSSSGSSAGVAGQSSSQIGKGVYGLAGSSSGVNYGVYGATSSPDGYGIYGENTALGNYAQIGAPGYGVRALCADEDGTGVRGECHNGSYAYGVWGRSTTGYAGYFYGTTHVHGDLEVTGSKNFKIDHPLDPENMYLVHSCIESSERLNVYSGNVVLDARGEAWVQLPDWFEAINGDFRYDLTPIGAPGPNLYIAQKIQDGCFAIAGGSPGMEVSWQVTGVRQDPYALAHPMQVEVEKPEAERGSYLHPELYGQPETRSVEWATKPEAMRELSRH